ncbi:hypothetical protein ABPG75_011704 [Micractinium tetrahymenae]
MVITSCCFYGVTICGAFASARPPSPCPPPRCPSRSWRGLAGSGSSSSGHREQLFSRLSRRAAKLRMLQHVLGLPEECILALMVRKPKVSHRNMATVRSNAEPQQQRGVGPPDLWKWATDPALHGPDAAAVRDAVALLCWQHSIRLDELCEETARQVLRLATACSAEQWLRQRIPDEGRLQQVLRRVPQLLQWPASLLQRQEDWLREQLGWCSARVGSFISDKHRAWAFARVDLSSEETEQKLFFLIRMAGVRSVEECIEGYLRHMTYSLEEMAALFDLVLDKAPHLHNTGGRPCLAWLTDRRLVQERCGLSAEELSAYIKRWPREKGQPLLATLRSGSTAGWGRLIAQCKAALAERQQPEGAAG